MCKYCLYRYQVLCYFVPTKELLNKASCSHFIYTIFKSIKLWEKNASKESLNFSKQTVSCTGTGTDQNFLTGCRLSVKAQAASNYRYEQLFYHSSMVFYLIATLWHFSHMYVPVLLSDGLIFFCFLLREGLRVVVLA